MSINICHCFSAAALALLGGAATAMAAENSYVPDAGGSWSIAGNWSEGVCPGSGDDVRIIVTGATNKTVMYDWSSTTGFDSIMIDGDESEYYAALWQLQGAIYTRDVKIGMFGSGWHWMGGDAQLNVSDSLYVGYQNVGLGQFHLDVEGPGLNVSELSYVGYHCEGAFDHLNGRHECNYLYVGQNAPGTYLLKGDPATSVLAPRWYLCVGNADVGTFEQTGGHLELDGSAHIILGLNTDGHGTYTMEGGLLDASRIEICRNGEGSFHHNGGVINITGDLDIGSVGTHPGFAEFKIEDTDGSAELYIAGDLNIGPHSLGRYVQNILGVTEVEGAINIGGGEYFGSSYIFMAPDADMLKTDVGVVVHSGYYHQGGGALEAPSFTDHSTGNIIIDGTADFRVPIVTHDAGIFVMGGECQVRGDYSGSGGVFNPCDFTNNRTFKMGSSEWTEGGTFTGTLRNNHRFEYYEGDFSGSTLINDGDVILNDTFTCKRFTNNAEFTLEPNRHMHITAEGVASSGENQGEMHMQARSHLYLGEGKAFTNRGQLYAGAPANLQAWIHGDVYNESMLQPCDDSSPYGRLLVDGDFTQLGSGILHLRLTGTGLDESDSLTVLDHAHFAGELEVELDAAYQPALGDSFTLVRYASQTGVFSVESLPSLALGRRWELSYTDTELTLNVIQAPPCPWDTAPKAGDGVVGLGDLNELLTNWGACPAPCEWDFAPAGGDEMVGLGDLNALLSNWGPCP